MSGYINFTKEFPKRCHDLLKVYPLARWADREVTLLLSVTSAALIVPVERLKKRTDPYPFHDRSNFPKARVDFDNLLSSNFYGSQLVSSPNGWYFGPLASTNSAPDFWLELQSPQPLPNTKKVKDVVDHIRNALAHGSVHTQGDPISELVFVASASYKSSNFNYLKVSPNNFLFFLQNWLEFLENMDFSP